jgi:hypothetical protein
MFWITVALVLAQADTQEVTIRRARNWSPSASEGWCAIKVWVDDEAEFALQGDRLRIFTARGREARDVASECSGPLPQNIENFSFRGVDGRGEVRLLEEPTRRNGWRAVVRIRDTKSGSEEYHYRLEWGRGSAFSNGGGRAGDRNRADGDAARLRTRDLRREIENMNRGRRLSADEIDDYIDRVRFDRWTLDDIQRDLERRR